ncbi:MAG: diacylglycerol kinase family protein [Thermoguttaceae bacterium]
MPPVVSTSTLSPDADRVAILVNPKAGPIAAQPGADRLAGLLEKRGYKVEVFTNLAAATSQANRWHAEGCLRTLVGVGGDGTAAELVNRTDEGLPLTLFPGGNSNLLARYLQMTKDPEFLCRTIVEGIVARLDAGRANGRIFLLMIGCGFDAEVVNRVHANRTGHISLKNYFRPVGEALWNYRYPEIQASWEEDEGTVPIFAPAKMGLSPCCDATRSLSARWLFVFNLPCYGGGFRIAPQSDGSDGLLDVCGFRGGGFWRHLAAVVFRRHHRTADWLACRRRRLRITAATEVPYQIDGDPGGRLPLDVEVLPGRLTVVVPKEAVP